MHSPATRGTDNKLAGWLGCVVVSLALATWLGPMGRGASAGPPRVLPVGELPADTRLGPLRGERGDFSFVPAASPGGWKARADRVRQIMRVSLGLWPMPTASPMNPVVHGEIDCGDYTVERVYFESIPGFYVTGNLYRPKGKAGKRPGVLSPHGHFPGGRFFDSGPDAVRRQIGQGAERFEDGGRSFMQSRCAHLARMGCVVFHYDMIGYGDSVQIPLEVAHRFSRLRVKFKEPPAHGLYSAEAELHLHNPMGLHTYNSMRAIGFLTGLEDVDPRRIAVTGGSGGGTQTFMLCAVDDRPLVSVPVVIVSTTRQGGCTCENISGLRIGTYNLEFTALHAPKPLLLISADDATRAMPERGFPQLKQHYVALGASDNVAHEAFLQFPHNYNCVSRAAMYDWLNRHLDLGFSEPIAERPYRRLTEEELSVWNDEHPRPKGGPAFERKLLEWLTNDAQKQMAALAPRDPESLARYREIVGTAWDVLLRKLPDSPDLRFQATRLADRGTYHQTLGLLSYRSVENHRAELPIVLLSPKEASRRTVIWISRQGKSGLYAADGSLKGAIRTLLDGGITVIGVDLLYQGEFLDDGRPIKRQRSLPDEEGYAGWTYCYNLPLFARRVHDVLAVVAFAKQEKGVRKEKGVRTLLCEAPSGPFRQKGPDPFFRPGEVSLVGLKGAGHWAAAATAQSHGTVARAAIDTGGFRFARLTDVYDADFLPGAAKYADLPGLSALAAPARLWLAGEGNEAPPVTRAAFAAARVPENLTLFSGESQHTEAAAVEWLLRPARQ